MDPKGLLKEAKNAIKNKNFQTALRLAKLILKEDRNNYMALVILGMALQELGPQDNVPKAFRKAIDLNPSNPLGWQGLISYYEKLNKDEDKGELFKLYTSYLNVETLDGKLLEYSRKLSAISAQTGNIKEACNTLLKASTRCSNQQEILELVVDMLETVREPEKPLELYESCLNRLQPVPKSFYTTYLQLLYKTGLHAKVLEHSIKMYQLFPDSVDALSWTCKLFNQMYIEQSSELVCNMEDMKGYSDQLIKLDSSNAMGLFTRALLMFNANDWGLAKDILIPVTTQRPGLVYAWVLLTDVLIKLKLLGEAQISLGKSQKLLKSMTNGAKLADKVLAQEITILSYSKHPEDWQKCDQILCTNQKVVLNECLPAITNLYINLGNFLKAEQCIKQMNLSEAQLYTFFKLKKQGKLQEAKQLIIENAAVNSNSTEWYIEVGLFYWQLEEYDKCLEPFLKAAKLEPDNYKCFIHLGHYYGKMGQMDKARRCYEKAISLNSLSSEAGCELSKIYRKQKNWEANQTLLTSLTKGLIDRSNIWVWLQLGLAYLEQGNAVNAIDCLRIVLRIEPENVHCWESLADAYFAKGAFTSALKCYQKAMELAGFSLYSALQMANIKKILGEFADARKNFDNILVSNDENYVPALKGLSETCLCEAKECLKDQRIGTARDYAQTALDNVTMAILQRSELSCLWKLLADCVLFVAKLPEKYSFLKLSHSLLGIQEASILDQNELYQLAVKFYCKTVSLDKDNGFFWHDLANCYLNYALNAKTCELFERALAAAQHSTALNPENWQHWNLLGNVATLMDPPNYALAQHSFIKAVIAESNSAVAWTNLGVLYLLMDDLVLANKAFGEGQRSDPNYVNSWIGQALVAETMALPDALDLFRHSTQLGQHQQGSLGYGRWVCDMLLHSSSSDQAVHYNIYNMHAIPVAYDNINWYTEKNPDDPCAWNMLGILAERLGLLCTATKSFKYAMALTNDNRHKMTAKINYARLLYRTGNLQGALEMFAGVKESNLSSRAGLALALFRTEQYEPSYAAYDEALHTLNEDQTSQSDLLVALATIAYKFQGVDGAKTLLFQSIGLKPRSPWSLYATFSLSLLHQDMQLAKLVLDELVNQETLSNQSECEYANYIHHYATLLAYFYQLKQDKKGAIAGLSKLIHRHPHISSTWLILSKLILQMETDRLRLKAGARCANIALKLGSKNMDASKVLCLAALSFKRAGDLQKATVFAQKAIHYSPQRAQGWASLLYLLLATSHNKNSSITTKLPKLLVDIDGGDQRMLDWSQSIVNFL